MRKTYVTKEEGRQFPSGCVQSWAHDFSQRKTRNDSLTTRYYLSLSPADQKAGLEILIFLSRFLFASGDQIARLLEERGLDAEPERILGMFLDSRILNCFTLSLTRLDDLPDDAYRIYCLDHGARFILYHFYREDFLSWRITDNFRCADQVAKYLSVAQFYLALAAEKGENLRVFEPMFQAEAGRRDAVFSAYFEIAGGAGVKRFLLESVRDSSLPGFWRRKVLEQTAPFLRKKYYLRLFPDEPIFLFLTESWDSALEAADIFYRAVNARQIAPAEGAGGRDLYTSFRVTTDGALQDGMEHAKFCRYVPDANRGMGALAAVRAPIFTRKES